MPLSHRTTAAFLLVCALGLLAGSSAAAPPAKKGVPRLVFPVIGDSTYTDDFGDARGQGGHEGNDIMAPRRAVAVAAESGVVRFHTTSSRAGCMLYLDGESGTQYLYIHLNNDLTAGNDNRGKCVAGVAYANGLKDGARVGAGQQIGYVGDSGDADGINPHLHFEVHPGGRGATNPYPYLQQAQRLLFAAKPGTPFALTLTGTVVSTTATQLTMNVASLQAWPAATKQKLDQRVTLAVPATATVQNKSGVAIAGRLLALARGADVVVWTQPALATLKAQRGDAGALSAALVQISS